VELDKWQKCPCWVHGGGRRWVGWVWWARKGWAVIARGGVVVICTGVASVQVCVVLMAPIM